ncbi:MAG: hypothetical protein ABIT71_07715 [Vicinamibacteraceae bacterium]
MPFQVSGSHSENLISRPMTPSTLQSGTGEVADVAAVIFTSGALKARIAAQVDCASTGAACPVISATPPMTAKKQRIRR